MPIEFACEECGSVLRVPDGSSGKRSRCPSCRHDQEIPWVVSSGEVAPASNKLSIPCPKCQHHLVCSPELLGTRGQCKKCQHIFTISTEPVAAESTAPALVFHCPKCRQLFEGNERMRGRKGKCHVCKAVFPIELELAKPTAAPIEKQTPTPKRGEPELASFAPIGPITRAEPGEDNDFIVIEDEPTPSLRRSSPAPAPAVRSPAPTPKPTPKPQPQPRPQPAAPPAPIRFECSQCRGVMEVPGSTAGLDTECPYCRKVQTIPQASTAPATTVAPVSPVADYSMYGTGQAPAAYDPLGSLDLGAPNQFANPYASPAPSSAWSLGTSGGFATGKASLSLGNVMQLGFESLFPSCLMYFVYVLTIAFTMALLWGGIIGLAYVLREQEGDAKYYIVTVAFALAFLVMGLLALWSAGCISRLALNAVRKQPFDFGEAMNPGGAFSAGLIVAGGGLLIMLFMYMPVIVHATTGAFQGMEGLMAAWFILFMPVLMLYSFGTTAALIAGADEESPFDAIKLSMSIVYKNFFTTLGALIISGLIASVLSIFTLGLANVIPIYVSAALYHLAKKRS